MDTHLQRSHDALLQCASTLTLDQLTTRPQGKWTIAEILEHLSRAFSATTVGARRAITDGRPAARQADFHSRLRTLIVVECGYLPAGYTAPKLVVPVGIEPTTALSVATENLRKMDDALGEAAVRFGTGVKLLNHPIIGPLSIRQWRRFHWVHTRHHIRQIIARTRGGLPPLAGR